MSYARFAVFKLNWCRALLIVGLPLACAAEVQPEFEDTGEPDLPADTAGTSAGGMLGSAGSSVLPKAGTTSTAGGVTSNPFGGTSSSGSSSGGKSSGGTSGGGASSGGTSSGGSAAGGKGGTGGAAGSSTGGGTGTGGCACPTKKTWADNTSISWVTGDCFDVAGALYLYTGVKAQTWANKDCNPTMQAAWCSDVGADYKFMLCK